MARRLLLTSAGITNATLREALAELVGKPFAEARVVLLPTAALADPGDHGWLLADMNRVHGLGWRQLDVLDRRILKILQRDSLIANQALADEIGLSPPACLKRVRRLRAAGVIERTVAVLSPPALGYPLLTVVRMARLVTPQMQRQGGGAIVNVSGMGAAVPCIAYPFGATFRRALTGFTKLYAARYGRDGIPRPRRLRQRQVSHEL